MLDVLIRGGLVLDGSGSPGRVADVGIAGGRIVSVGRADPVERAARVIDGGGLMVAPGFIDMHSHADYTLPAYPDALNSLAQGVTTEVIGNCGFTPAPLADDPALAEATRLAGRGLGPSLDWAWRSFGSYLDQLDAARPAVNCIPLVGHGTIRHAVMGAEDRPATEDERAAMREVLAAALTEGAWGMSTGLVYPPGSFAATDEIVAIGEPLRAIDGIYFSHIRNESDRLDAALLEAVDVGRQLGIRVQVSHIKTAGIEYHGRMPAALALLDAARASGVAVTQDVYPYIAASTLLNQLIPPWVHEGGNAHLVARLRSSSVRQRIAAEVRTGLPGWPNYIASSGGWSAIIIAAVVDPGLRHLEGQRIDEAAARAGVDPLELVFDTLVADQGSTAMIMFMMDAADVDLAIAHPSSAIGSDQFGVVSPTARVHPRAYGSFVRVLAGAVRQRGVLDLPTAVHRMTGLPAQIMRLPDRGRLSPGAIADVVVFDAATVTDRATFQEPTLLPVGIEAVVVNGHLAMYRGDALDARAGHVLRRGQASTLPA